MPIQSYLGLTYGSCLRFSRIASLNASISVSSTGSPFAFIFPRKTPPPLPRRQPRGTQFLTTPFRTETAMASPRILRSSARPYAPPDGDLGCRCQLAVRFADEERRLPVVGIRPAA